MRDYPQAKAGKRLYRGEDLVSVYANRDLRPVEATILDRHREALTGRVLELGCGAGRVTGHLCEIAATVHGIDISAPMLEYCRRAYPAATFSKRDLRDLSDFETGAFDAVVASFNVIDVLDDADRRRALLAVGRVLGPGGILVMSSHNRAYAPQVRGPLAELGAQLRSKSARGVVAGAQRLPRRLSNRRRLGRFQVVEDEYAILNDRAHDYSMLHYYISRDGQERQLEAHGFELVECLDLDGEPVAAGQPVPGCPELHYVARLA